MIDLGGFDTNEIYQGDVRELIQLLPDNSIDCVITSPPYWGLRNYNVENQLGLEKTFEEYINNLIGIFVEVKRVLKPSGTCWVNLGDSYSGSNGNRDGACTDNSWKRGGHISEGKRPTSISTIPAKSQCCIPERFAIAMIDRLGWIKRNTIIWYKRNAMPSSAKDRFTVDFESVIFFVKSGKYYFEQQKEPAVQNRWGGHKPIDTSNSKDVDNQFGGLTRERDMMPEERNKRCVWDIPTKPFPGAHFAVFPTALVEPMILAGCPVDGVVLDPFAGAGTVRVAAMQHGRASLGFELNPEYIKIADERMGTGK